MATAPATMSIALTNKRFISISCPQACDLTLVSRGLHSALWAYKTKKTNYIPKDQVKAFSRRSDVMGALLVLHCWGLIIAAAALFITWPNPLTFLSFHIRYRGAAAWHGYIDARSGPRHIIQNACAQ